MLIVTREKKGTAFSLVIPSSSSCFQLPASADPGSQLGIAQVVGSLSPTWDTWIEFAAPGSRCSCYRHLGSELVDVFVCVSLCLSVNLPLKLKKKRAILININHF